MRLYYTGNKVYQSPQPKKESSLGGFQSTSVVPNNQSGNLFGNISPFDKQNELTEVIGLVLKNEIEDILDLLFYFDIPENAVGKYEIAVVTLSQNSKGQSYMEDIPNNQSLPYHAEFHEVNGLENAVSLGSLSFNGLLGIWIKRTVNFSVKTDDQLWDDYVNQVQNINNEIIGLQFFFDESSSNLIIDTMSRRSGSAQVNTSETEVIFMKNGVPHPYPVGTNYDVIPYCYSANGDAVDVRIYGKTINGFKVVAAEAGTLTFDTIIL